MEEIKERKWDILNGNINGDEKGEVTYIGARGTSVIDYAITSTETRGKIDRMVIENKTESDHLPICIYL